MTLEDRCRPIALILSDVDGVMTDGRIYLDNHGIESKSFHVHDGLAIRLWQKAGGKFGMVTQRSAQSLKIRAAELGVEIVRQGVTDKLAALKQILEECNLSREQVCYLGDDLPDLPVMRVVGLSVTVADGCGELRAAAGYQTKALGGAVAVREVVELILNSQNRWNDVIQTYLQ